MLLNDLNLSNMKKCLLFFCIFYVNSAFSQLQDSFDDKDFTNSPAWLGSTSSFCINKSGQLQSVKSDSAGMIYLATANRKVTEATWEFYIQLNFSPSASNFARIYLQSDKQDLNEDLNGYFIQIGENGSKDSYDLYRKNGDSEVLLIDGKDGRANGSKIATRIRVNKTSEGKWILLTKNAEENAFTEEGQASDSKPVENTGWFGVQCVYSKSRSDQFIFDDFKIGPLNTDPGTTPEEPGGFEGEKIMPGDILISEVLFNPRGEGADFVEIYNNSSKLMDLSDLSLATIKKDTLSSIKKISVNSVKFAPGQYIVLTTDPENIKNEYHTEHPDAFVKMTSMPAFNNDAGTVILYADSSRIDEFSYTEKMHFPLIKNPDGVSLERVSFSVDANSPGNFRSAAGAAGYATPTYKNSQFVENVVKNEDISLYSTTFSPDNDGFEDALMISYKLKDAGMIANITIYNDRGVPIKRVAKNLTLGTEGTISWDGMNDNNTLAPAGIYIVYAELFDINGHVKKYRKPCALATRL